MKILYKEKEDFFITPYMNNIKKKERNGINYKKKMTKLVLSQLDHFHYF